MTEVRRRSPLAIVLGVLGTLVSAMGVFVALLVAAMRCDEGCSDTPVSWHENADAWQWDGQLALAGGAALLVLVGLGLAIARRRSVRPYCVAAVAWLAWFVWIWQF
jgi:hypothetical protein